MALRQSARVPFLATLLALSGACALVYQIAWLREFRLVFGGATPATAAVLAIFMGGLGVGSAWIGRRLERTPDPLRLYGTIEIGVGVSALLTPILLAMARALYVKTGGVVALGLLPATLLQLLMATVVLAVPCILMGGSLPAAFQSVETKDDRQRGSLGVLYGINTLGAVVGVLASTFWLLEHWGIRATVTAAAIVNILIGVAAWLATNGKRQPQPRQKEKETPGLHPAGAPAAFVYSAAALTGFTFFLSELVWFRMLAPLVGSSVYGFGIILALALAGIGIGGLLYRLVLAPRAGAVSPGTLALVAASQALLIIAPFAAGDRIAVLAIDLSHSGTSDLAGRVYDWTVLSSLLVFGPSVMAGVQFPLTVGLLGDDPNAAGRDVGYAYAANTIGAIAGSLLGGFLVIPLFTAPGTWKLVAFLTAVLAAGAQFIAAKSSPRRHQVTVGGLILASLALMVFPVGPTAAWRHQPIGYGRVEALPHSINARRYRLDATRLTTSNEFEGRESSVAISSGNTGWGFFVNGKSDGAAFGDANTQVMLGLLPAMLHPSPRRAFVVGLGTGSTAGWLADVPGMDRVDVAELEPRMAELARTYYAPVNRDAMSKPNVNLIVGDAREALFVSGDQYDLIASEPSNPYRAGVSTLFTREYYEAVRARLAQGGLFAQWLQGYEVDARAVQLVYATLASVFPYVETWVAGSNDLVFITHASTPGYSIEQLRRRVVQAPFAEALRRVWFTRSVEGVLAHHVASPEVALRIARLDQASNSDDRNQLEYGFARALAQAGSFNTLQLIVNADLPAHLADQVDRSRVQLERLLMLAPEVENAAHLSGLQGDDVLRANAVNAFIEKQYDKALKTWVGPLLNPMEQLLLLRAAAEAGSADQVLPLLQQVVGDWPADARFSAARTASRHNAEDQAVAHLREGFLALRTQVWAQPQEVESALELVAKLARGNPERSQLLFEVIRQPFPGGIGEVNRLRAIAEIGSSLPPNRQVEVATLFEPYPVWTRPFLEFRANAYRAAGDLKAAKAAADLREFDRYDVGKK